MQESNNLLKLSAVSCIADGQISDCYWFDLQGDLNLNICEAHAFNTKDNFSLDVFVVSGWTGQVSFAPWPLCIESLT